MRGGTRFFDVDFACLVHIPVTQRFRVVWLRPFRSQWSIGPRKPLLAIVFCFGLSFQAATRCSLLCSPRHLPSSSSCFWDGLGSSSPVGSISVPAWWHCSLFSWGCAQSNPTFAFLSGCWSFPAQLLSKALHLLWPLASGCPWWISGICW